MAEKFELGKYYKHTTSDKIYRAMAKFSKEGILVYHDLARKWLNNPYWLVELLTGDAVIVDD